MRLAAHLVPAPASTAVGQRLGVAPGAAIVPIPERSHSLRAESGTGTFRLETGWIEGGRRLRIEHGVPPRPDAREVRMTLRHERETAGGHLAIELAGALDAGHVRGERDASLGVAWRTS